MSHTPTNQTQQGNAATAKPSLAGVRVRQRKGQAKAAAKLDPEGEFVVRGQDLGSVVVLESPLWTFALVDALQRKGKDLVGGCLAGFGTGCRWSRRASNATQLTCRFP